MKPDVIPTDWAGLQERCWRHQHRIDALEETIAVLRAGADALALRNLELQLELAELRTRPVPDGLRAYARLRPVTDPRD
jgi:hypothetical protein